MTKQEILGKAAEILKDRGWCPQFTDAAGRVCIMHAVGLAVRAEDLGLGPDIQAAVMAVVGAPASDWNDGTCRDEAEAIFALDAARQLVIQEEGHDVEEVLS